MNGLLLINKPQGITSFDVIRRLRRTTGIKKIGHAGTLDPMATGLMLILIGTGTKQAMALTKLDKEYVAELTLGAVSTTGDAEGDLKLISDSVPPEEAVLKTLDAFTGEIIQIPSIYSAIKIKGKEAYKRARAGEKVEMPSRKVTIYESELISYKYPIVRFRTRVTSGTYIRSLGEDVGMALGTGGYLTALQRTKVGEYSLESALPVEASAAELQQALISL